MAGAGFMELSSHASKRLCKISNCTRGDCNGIVYGRESGVEGNTSADEDEDGQHGGGLPWASAVGANGTGECAYARPYQRGLLRHGYAGGADGAGKHAGTDADPGAAVRHG